MKYEENNIKISGYIKNMNDDSELILKGNKEYVFKLNKTSRFYLEVAACPKTLNFYLKFRVFAFIKQPTL